MHNSIMHAHDFLIGTYCCSLIPNHQSDGACDFHSKGSSYILKGILYLINSVVNLYDFVILLNI